MPGRGGVAFAGGLALGAVVGGALALYLGPWNDDGTRDILRAKAREASNRAKDTLADLSDQARSAASEGAANLGDAYARGSKAVDDVRFAVDDAVREGQDAARSHRAELEQRYLKQRSPA
ncbi:MAG: hypothetical protein JO060_08860 [Candidatus Eremiobacteraeota bacterium]|nr:hypothetical protein [Candidatus Eremiobacteraeota bacterium]MBV9647682.1 hypothetical protein [Candidatus Eremiobacteraeota bacterium]